uniref:Uncharacterized protein n=1 Tax=Nelumbo nucifera TaxID=4432 RepID=A0A822Z2M0_NELNU|nr:TPA_asm: hypothetical protein HUJ06_013076 [Nelumbo nucifera]
MFLYLRCSGSNTSAVHSSLTTDHTHLGRLTPCSSSAPRGRIGERYCSESLPVNTASSSPPAPARCTLSISPWRELGSEAEPTRNQRCKLRHSCRAARSMTSHSRAVSSTHCTPRESEQAHEQLLTR